jgi:hypothetical protein
MIPLMQAWSAQPAIAPRASQAFWPPPRPRRAHYSGSWGRVAPRRRQPAFGGWAETGLLIRPERGWRKWTRFSPAKCIIGSASQRGSRSDRVRSREFGPTP